MKNFVKKLLFTTAGVFAESSSSFNQLRSLSGVKVTVPFYHAISDSPLPHLKHIIPCKTTGQFRNEVAFFSKNYTFITISELHDHLYNNTELPPNPMIITFDDGLREFYDYAIPVLDEYHATAAVFVNSGFLDNRSLFYRHKASLLVEKILSGVNQEQVNSLSNYFGVQNSPRQLIQKILSIDYLQRETLDHLALMMKIDFNAYLEATKPYLTSQNLEEIIIKGYFVGGHSIDHPEYKQLTVEQQIDQTVQSMNTIAARFPQPCRIFATPFLDTELTQQYFDSILPEHVNISFGINGVKQDSVPLNIQRFNMEGEQYYPAGRMLTAYYLVMVILKLFHLNKLQRD